jgi:hypothetical protein
VADYTHQEDGKQIPIRLTELFAIVDKTDYETITSRSWWLNNTGYAYSYERGSPKKLLMHRFIMRPPQDMVVDHINGDKLDNRRSNLRICTQRENAMNKPSIEHGVSYRKEYNRWRAYITVNGKQVSLGHYSTREEAIKARLSSEAYYYGKFGNAELSSAKDFIPNKGERDLTRARIESASGYKNIRWDGERQAYRVLYKRNKVLTYVGSFKSLQEAIDARNEAILRGKMPIGVRRVRYGRL